MAKLEETVQAARSAQIEPELDLAVNIEPEEQSRELTMLLKSCHAFQKNLRNPDWGSLTFAGESLPEALVKFSEVLNTNCALFSAFSKIYKSGAGDRQLQDALLALTVKSLLQNAATPEETLLLTLYKASNPTQDGKGVALRWPDWLKTAHKHLSAVSMSAALPDADTYLSQSLSAQRDFAPLSGQRAELQKACDEVRSKYETLQAIKPEAENPFERKLRILEAQLRENKQSIFNLALKINDVFPDKMPQVLSALKVDVAPTNHTAAAILECGRGLEKLLMLALSPNVNSQAKASLNVPAFDQAGKIQLDTFTFNNRQLAAIHKDPKFVCTLLDTLVHVREVLRFILELNPERLPANSFEIKNFLMLPFSSFGKPGLNVYRALPEFPEPAIKRSFVRLLSDPIYSGEKEYGQSLAALETLKPLSWITVNLINAAPEERAPYQGLLKAAPAISKIFLPLLVSVVEQIDGGNYQEAARIINSEIESCQNLTLKNSPDNVLKALSPIVILAAILTSQKAREKLRNQIPSLDSIKEQVEGMTRYGSPFAQQVSELARTCERNLSFSMVDFYREPGMSDLWDFVERFKVYLRHPHCLEGLAGNEAMRSGILVAGEPGVGKTFFVECLANELGLKLLRISPDEGEVSSSKRMIDACRNTIEEAKKHVSEGNACILFIDEAEVVMADRDNPRTTQEQAELTCYLLQEINEIRVKYPRILLVAATNYIGRIDSGMFRMGRFDIEVPMKRPGPEMRKNIISGTLAREKIELNLTEEQMQQLVEATDGLIALPIKRVIYEFNRIGRLLAAAEGRSFELTFDNLLKEFEAERRRISKRLKSEAETELKA